MKNKKGFTLIELLAVISLIMVIALIAIPQVRQVMKRTDKKAFLATVETFKKAAETYVLEYGPVEEGKLTLKELINKGLIKQKINNPLTNENFTGNEYIYITNIYNEEGTAVVNKNYSFVANEKDSKDFIYEEVESQTFNVPETGEYILEVWGAQGGDGGPSIVHGNFLGGTGGYASGTVNLTKGEILYIYIGRKGRDFNDTTTASRYNGAGISVPYSGSTSKSGDGGGATDIRLKGGNWDNPESLNNRIIVAGGGGGAGFHDFASIGNPSFIANGGPGGGVNGLDGLRNNNGIGEGGEQESGNAFGKGGSSTPTSGSRTGAGGGGGWFGGKPSANGNLAHTSGGGGGSGCVVTKDSYKPTGYQVGEDYFMTNIILLDGNTEMPNPIGGTQTGHKGNGYARITRVY